MRKLIQKLLRKQTDSVESPASSEIIVSDKTILEEYSGKSGYVYSKTYDRIFKALGNVQMNDEPGNDGVPIILTDKDGDMDDFIILKAENTYEVVSIPTGFDYKKYAQGKY